MGTFTYFSGQCCYQDITKYSVVRSMALSQALPTAQSELAAEPIPYTPDQSAEMVKLGSLAKHRRDPSRMKYLAQPAFPPRQDVQAYLNSTVSQPTSTAINLPPRALALTLPYHPTRTYCRDETLYGPTQSTGTAAWSHWQTVHAGMLNSRSTRLRTEARCSSYLRVPRVSRPPPYKPPSISQAQHITQSKLTAGVSPPVNLVSDTKHCLMSRHGMTRRITPTSPISRPARPWCHCQNTAQHQQQQHKQPDHSNVSHSPPSLLRRDI